MKETMHIVLRTSIDQVILMAVSRYQLICATITVTMPLPLLSSLSEMHQKVERPNRLPKTLYSMKKIEKFLKCKKTRRPVCQSGVAIW